MDRKGVLVKSYVSRLVWVLLKAGAKVGHLFSLVIQRFNAKQYLRGQMHHKKTFKYR